jgi:hypothetical protein
VTIRGQGLSPCWLDQPLPHRELSSRVDDVLDRESTALSAGDAWGRSVVAAAHARATCWTTSIAGRPPFTTPCATRERRTRPPLSRPRRRPSDESNALTAEAGFRSTVEISAALAAKQKLCVGEQGLHTDQCVRTCLPPRTPAGSRLSCCERSLMQVA